MARLVAGLARIALAMSGFGAAQALHSAQAAEPVMVQCGREYQAAKLAGTLGGLDWNRYRADCAARLKATPAAAAPAPEAPVVAATPAASVPQPASPAAASPASGGGRAAATARQRQCGAEWRANKATLVAQTAGLTWPRYWSQCNTRLKAAGQ